jgi:hypothetical protein
VREVYDSIDALVPKAIREKLIGQRELYIEAQGDQDGSRLPVP